MISRSVDYQNFLVIHYSPMISKVIREYIKSEFHNVKIFTAQTCCEIENILLHHKIDFILSSRYTKKFDASDIVKLKEKSPLNTNTPVFILATSREEKRNFDSQKPSFYEQAININCSSQLAI